MPADTPSTSPANAAFSIRAAARGDVAANVRLIHGLAEFEKLTHLFFDFLMVSAMRKATPRVSRDNRSRCRTSTNRSRSAR